MQDDDPYVRKTAAVCVAKLFDINPELVEDRGFLDMLRVRGRGASGARANALPAHTRRPTRALTHTHTPLCCGTAVPLCTGHAV
jgi:hypothetical protein